MKNLLFLSFFILLLQCSVAQSTHPSFSEKMKTEMCETHLTVSNRMVVDILMHCRTDVAFASLKSVTTFEKSNSMHSFLFAETFKYAYLIFADDKAIDLNKIVFNTEAHPFKITN